MTFQGFTSNGMSSNDDEYISQFLVFDDKQCEIEETVEMELLH